MIKKILRAIHDLRIFLFGVITASFFFTYCADPINLVQWLGSRAGLAANIGVGSQASVPENQYNSLAAQLAAKEKSLNEKEADLARRSAPSSPVSENILATGIVILFFLILLNYYLDYHRRRVELRQRAI